MNATHSKPAQVADFGPEQKRLQPENHRVPDGLVEWISAVDSLDGDEHGFAATDIERVERYWHHAEIGFSSAGFVVVLKEGRRVYLQCALDDDAPDLVAISIEELVTSQDLPAFPSRHEPLGGWRVDVAPFAKDLARLRH